MTHSRNNFTNAIAGYLENHGNRVNMYSLATRHTYTLVVGDSNVKRSELNCEQLDLISMVEDLAASYIALEGVHPVEAVELAYQEVMARDVVALSVLFKFTSLPYRDSKLPNMLLLRRQAMLELLMSVPDNDNWLYEGNEDAWLHYSYSS